MIWFKFKRKWRYRSQNIYALQLVFKRDLSVMYIIYFLLVIKANIIFLIKGKNCNSKCATYKSEDS